MGDNGLWSSYLNSPDSVWCVAAITTSGDNGPSTVVYAGTNGAGIYQSINGGSWSAVNTGLSNMGVEALAIDPTDSNFVYAATYPQQCGDNYCGGVFRSANGGGNWDQVGTELAYQRVVALAIDPKTPTTLYAGLQVVTNETSSAGVWQSTDRGYSFNQVGPELAQQPVAALAIDPKTPTTLYAATWGAGVWQSTNSGASWSAITGLSNPYVIALAIDPSTTPSTLYAAIWGAGVWVYQSTNSGASWSAVTSGLTNTGVYALAIGPSTLYAGTIGGGVFEIQLPVQPGSPERSKCAANMAHYVAKLAVCIANCEQKAQKPVPTPLYTCEYGPRGCYDVYNKDLKRLNGGTDASVGTILDMLGGQCGSPPLTTPTLTPPPQVFPTSTPTAVPTQTPGASMSG
jgi:hypothetical protein